YDLLNKYLNDLEQNGFIVTTGNLRCLTDKGQRLLDLLVKRENVRKEVEDLEFRISMMTSRAGSLKEIEISKIN
ncbi:MAG: winged helix-turn-helix domain-containing protein, partial [Metallosphaera sp.]